MSSPRPARTHSLMVVSDTYPPVIGGAEFDVQRVCAELIRRGHRAIVLCAGGAPMPAVDNWVDPAGVPVRILTRNETGRAKHILFALRVARELWRSRSDYGLVYFSMQGLHLAAGLPVARLAGKPIFMKVHGSTVIPAMARSRMGKLELKWLRQWASKVMLLNDEMFQEARDQGFAEDQLLFMPNPVDTDAFRPATADERRSLREEFFLPADAFVFAYVGRLSPEKGVDWLLQAFARVAPRFPQGFLLLVGDGPMRPDLEQLVASLSLSPAQVRFAGRVPNADVPRWLRAADAFALVSPNEGFSCALAEAMAAGLAAVVSDIPANTQLVEDGVHGRLVPPGDVEAIAAALASLMGDPPRVRDMAVQARRQIETRFSTQQVVDFYETLFEETLL